MKLSEMTNKQAMECMANLAAPLQTILRHEAVKNFMTASSEKEINAQLGLDALINLVPVLTRDCYAETTAVEAALLGISPAAVEAMPFVQVVQEIRDSIDADFIKFFRPNP